MIPTLGPQALIFSRQIWKKNGSSLCGVGAERLATRDAMPAPEYAQVRQNPGDALSALAAGTPYSSAQTLLMGGGLCFFYIFFNLWLIFGKL